MSKRVIATDAAPKPISPISQATMAAGFVFTQGILGRSVTGTMPDSMAGQARQAMESLKHILQAANGSLSDVLRVEVFVTDLGEMGEFNHVFQEYFPVDPPARIGVQVTHLAARAKVEITAVAYVGQ